MAKVTFKTLNPDAPLFAELSIYGKYKWWERMKKHPELYIEVRKDNNINVYYQGGSVVRLHYCTRHKKIQAFTHPKYLGKKGKNYVNCVAILDEMFDSILENIRTHYSQKKGVSKEKWSEKYIQGNIIVNSRYDYIDSEFAYVKDGIDIRIDLVECVAGVLRFVELKRIDDNRMVSSDMHPEILSQVASYRGFIKQHEAEIINYYQRLYAIKKTLELPIPYSEPRKLNPKPKLLIFDRWVKETEGRSVHRAMMEKILEKIANPPIDYSIINSLDVPHRLFYREELCQQKLFYNNHLKGIAPIGGFFKGKERDFMLKDEYSHYNLFFGIVDGADKVIDYFNDRIAWWGENEDNKKPTGHLVSSQIHCLNHIFALRNDPDAVKVIIQGATKLEIDKVLHSPIDKQGYITFEFVYKNIGLLGEKFETRGAKCTSVDALVYVELVSGKKILIPIEWKYTETYNGIETREESFGRYTKRHKDSNCQKWTSMLRADPYYELMRQTLLVEQIIQHKDCGIEADDYFHVMVIPNEHSELRTAIEGNYIPTLKDSSKFKIIDPQEFLSPISSLKDKKGNKKYADLLDYLKTRYWQ